MSRGDITVDEYTGKISGLILHHDGLDQSVGLFIAVHGSLKCDQLTLDLAGGHLL